MNKYARLEMKHRQDKYIIGGVLAALVVIGGLMAWLSTLSPNAGNRPNTTDTATSSATVATSTFPAEKVADLAAYLAANKITMYGADWCTHCQDQKASFGAAWSKVPYVECPKNTKLCLSKGVEGYPTWLKPTGEKIEGFTPLDELATWAGFKF